MDATIDLHNLHENEHKPFSDASCQHQPCNAKGLEGVFLLRSKNAAPQNT